MANLSLSDLRGADLSSAVMSGAHLAYADVAGAIYEPQEDPEAGQVALAKNLGLLAYRQDAAPLARLRASLQAAGFPRAARWVNAALWRHDAAWWETALFDWTCEFGANPARPLWIMAGVYLTAAVLYLAAMHGSGRAGLYRISRDFATGSPIKSKIHERTYSPIPGGSAGSSAWLWRKLRLVAWAALFGLMSALRFGNLNFGNGFLSLTKTEYDLVAVGWPRTVQGVQSLLCLLLTTLAVSSYFVDVFPAF
jgi:hypothetical protein